MHFQQSHNTQKFLANSSGKTHKGKTSQRERFFIISSRKNSGQSFLVKIQLISTRENNPIGCLDFCAFPSRKTCLKSLQNSAFILCARTPRKLCCMDQNKCCCATSKIVPLEHVCCIGKHACSSSKLVLSFCPRNLCSKSVLYCATH